MSLKFGTDGVRGAANTELTPELALALGRAAARVIGGRTWLVGRDPRISGPLLQAALVAGLASEGASVCDIGMLPTPGVAHLSACDSVPAAMISASHNPFADNGIKLFSAGGLKLSDQTEERLESVLADIEAEGIPGASNRRSGAEVGQLSVDLSAVQRYASHLVHDVIGDRRLTGLKVVVDCANGASSAVGPDVLTALGAEVTVLNAEPDGININADCGSNHPAALQRAVVARKADVGLAFDGDADRLVAVDANGELVDGDHIIAICALDLKERGRLVDDTVVVTVMTNLGFRHAMARHGVTVLETDVGDRYVLEALARGGYSLGGEQSGHVVFRELASTGDGVLTGINLLDAMARSDRGLADLASVMQRLPQVLRNVTVAHRDESILDRLANDIASAADRLGDDGRVLVRTSGTEPLVRVMVEATTTQVASDVADELVAAVTRVTG